MKSWHTRLISLLLAFALLVSCFAVMATATDEDEVTEGEEEETVTEPIVAYNRDYSDGWDFYNGMGISKSIMKQHKLFVDKQTTADYSSNYFARVEAADTVALGQTCVDNANNQTDGFGQLSFETLGYPRTGHVFVEFDIMIDDLCNLGSILYFRTEGGGAGGVTVTLLSIQNEHLYVFPNNIKGQEGIPLSEEWQHVVIDIDYTNETYDPNEQFDMHITVGEETFSITVKAKVYGNVGADIFRFGLPPVTPANGAAESAARAGQSWCFDNLWAYCNTDRRLTEEELDAQGYGELVNENQVKTIVIDGAGADKTVEDHINESLCMKVGVDYALVNGEQLVLADLKGGAPVEYDGQVVVPLLPILEYMGTGSFAHEDGKSYDISTGVSASYLTIGRDIATVNGEVVALTMAPGYYTDKTGNKYAVIALDDVERLLPGYYVTYDTMGLIIIGKVDEILTREYNLNDMLDLMNRFIYNFIDAETVYETAKEITNDFTHPYVMGGQEVFDKMTAIWNGTDTKEYDVDLKYYITKQVDRAYHFYEAFALGDPVLDENGDPVLDEEGNVVYGDTHNSYHGLDWSCEDLRTLNYPHVENFGYDPYGGRQAESGTVTNWAFDIAFGYVVTGDIKLAQLAYDILVAVGEWNHWCPGHFLNCADAAKSYAIAFDWIYQGIAALESGEYDDEVDALDGKVASEYYSNEYLEYLLYKNGVRMGYLASTNQHHGWTRYVLGEGGQYVEKDVYYYTTMVNNWNAVCSSGMWIASLALLGSDLVGDLGEGEGAAPVAETSAWLISNNLETMALHGMVQYAPDGSYVESPGYWGYGTNSLYYGLMAIWRCLGDDFGFLDAAGMDKTCYFACNVESSDFRQFAYHDASEYATVDTKCFYFVAEAMDDPVLAEIRKLHNNGGKGMNINDFLYYPYDNEDAGTDVELPLDYYMEGIDAFTTRSSWDKGALFAGIIGGSNSASHGQVDSGTFVYHNAGAIWLTDLGSDEYNVYHYFTSPDRYRYYRMNAEGHNVLTLTSKPDEVPYGQKLGGWGYLTDWMSNDYGSYAIIDNTSAYASTANLIRRGMLLTNDRKTLVIQDEVLLSGVETFYWCAHFNMVQNDGTYLDYEIAPNGRTMYLIRKNNRGNTLQTLRLSIVSRTTSEKFVITSAGETEEDRLLKGDKGTVDYSWSTSMGALVGEKSRENYKRITIKTTASSFNMAVVIELVENREDPIGYSKLISMSDWVPSGDTSVEVPEDEIEQRGFPKVSNIASHLKNANTIYRNGRAFTSGLENYYYHLTYIHYTRINFYPDELRAYQDELAEFDEKVEEYNEFINEHNARVANVRSLSLRLMGV